MDAVSSCGMSVFSFIFQYHSVSFVQRNTESVTISDDVVAVVLYRKGNGAVSAPFVWCTLHRVSRRIALVQLICCVQAYRLFFSTYRRKRW